MEAQLDTNKDRFIKHGYEKTLVENQIKKVEKSDRRVLLWNKIKLKKHHVFHYQSLITGHFHT